MSQYEWKYIDFPRHLKYWKKHETSNKSIALNVLYVPQRKKEVRQTYTSKYDSERLNQIILSMVTNGKKWDNLAVKNISKLLRGITSNHDRDYFCINCFYSFAKKEKLNLHENLYKNHHYCHMEMPEGYKNILKYNQDKLFW